MAHDWPVVEMMAVCAYGIQQLAHCCYSSQGIKVWSRTWPGVLMGQNWPVQAEAKAMGSCLCGIHRVGSNCVTLWNILVWFMLWTGISVESRWSVEVVTGYCAGWTWRVESA